MSYPVRGQVLLEIKLTLSVRTVIFYDFCYLCSDEGVDVSTDSSLKGQRSFSVDSLFDTSSIISTEDAAGRFQSQSNQIFIGMVTMQYQARQVISDFSFD